MNLTNVTRVTAGWTLGVAPSGHESVVVVVTATYDLPDAGREPVLADEQLDLVDADEFTGERRRWTSPPLASAPRGARASAHARRTRVMRSRIVVSCTHTRPQSARMASPSGARTRTSFCSTRARERVDVDGRT